MRSLCEGEGLSLNNVSLVPWRRLLRLFYASKFDPLAPEEAHATQLHGIAVLVEDFIPLRPELAMPLHRCLGDCDTNPRNDAQDY